MSPDVNRTAFVMVRGARQGVSRTTHCNCETGPSRERSDARRRLVPCRGRALCWRRAGAGRREGSGRMMTSRQTLRDPLAERLIGPGRRFEIEEALVQGLPQQVFKG